MKTSALALVILPLFPYCPFSSLSLEYSSPCPASRPELIPTRLPNKLWCNCLSKLSAHLFFFSPPRTWQETHIYTQKWNYGQLESRSFWRNACYRAVQVDELLSPLALLYISSMQRWLLEERETRRKRECRQFCHGLMTYCICHSIWSFLPLLFPITHFYGTDDKGLFHHKPTCVSCANDKSQLHWCSGRRAIHHIGPQKSQSQC